MKTLINKDSLVVGNFPMRKVCIIEILIDSKYRGYIPFYMSSGTNNNKIQGKWYPILGIFNKGENVKNIISYFVKIACGNKYDTLKNGWLMKSPFFVHYDGYTLDNDKTTNGFGNHKFTKTLEKISDEIQSLYENNHYTKNDNLQYELNSIFNNQKDVDYLVQYMVLGDIIKK